MSNALQAGHAAVTGVSHLSLVRDVYQAYSSGKAKPKDTFVEDGLREFLTSLKQRVVPRLSREELILAARCKRFCNLAREAAGRYDVSSACQAIGVARSCAESGVLGTEARLLCEAETTPAEAYLDLCCGDLENAERRFLRAMEIDQELEERYGHRLVHGHRIHLQINMVTLDGRALRLRQAARRALEIFLYIAGQREALPVRGSWGRNLVALLSPGMIQLFAQQLTYEIAGILSDLDSAQVKEFLGTILDDVGFNGAQNVWNPTTRGWFELKVLSTGDPVSYLEQSISFLEAGPGSSLAIWQAGALEIADVCNVLCPGQAVDFEREVQERVRRLTYVPYQLKRRVSRLHRELLHSKAR